MESPHLLRASKWGECAFKTGGLRHGCYAVHIAVKAGTIAIGSRGSHQSMRMSSAALVPARKRVTNESGSKATPIGFLAKAGDCI